MKFQAGDMVISGPYVLTEKGSGQWAREQPDELNHLEAKPERTVHQISKDRGSHVILSRVREVRSQGILVEARYLVWDEMIEAPEGLGFEGNSFLPADSKDYALTDLWDRERNNPEHMIAWLQYDGQSMWIAEHEPEEAV